MSDFQSELVFLELAQELERISEEAGKSASQREEEAGKSASQREEEDRFLASALEQLTLYRNLKLVGQDRAREDDTTDPNARTPSRP